MTDASTPLRPSWLKLAFCAGQTRRTAPVQIRRLGPAMWLSDAAISMFWHSGRRYEVLEPIYKAMFERELARIGLSDQYYPIKGAANYSLLFLLLRIIVEHRPPTILELGAGESTILLSQMAGLGFECEIDTLESNEYWANRIQQKAPNANVHYSPLSRRRHSGLSFIGYDLSLIRAKRYDLVLIDGPNGTPGLSRASGLEVAASHLNQDFMIVLDDAERFGERRMMRRMIRNFQRSGIRFKRETTRSIKWQVVMATRKYEPAIYL